MSKIDTGDASEGLAREGTLSPSVADSLGRNSRTVEVPHLGGLFDDPVFSCFLIDASGSMQPYANDVIEGQAALIDILRKSTKAKNKALFVVQYLFSDSVEILHPFTALSSAGGDGVILLNSGHHYRPGGLTALYQSVLHLLQDMAANIANAKNEGISSTFTIGVITDGADTEGGIRPEEIKSVLKELHDRRILRSSVIIGLTNKKFTETMLEDLRDRLGFQDAVSVSQDPQSVRRAFVLASQAAVSGQAE